MIKLQVIGHLGKDCNVNSVNGKNVINFSVAHSEKYKDASGTEINKTTWVNCAYWVERTGIAQYLKKGTLVFCEGQPEVHTYKGTDGQHRSDLKCRVLNIQLLGGGNKDNTQPNIQAEEPTSGTGYVAAPNANNSSDDDLPF